MKTIKANGFVVWEDTNKTDGFGPSFICATAITKEAAEKEAVGRGVMGFPGDIRPKEIFVFEFNGQRYCVAVDKCTLVEE